MGKSAASSSPSDLTELLVRWSEGDSDALEQLLPVVYRALRRIALRQLQRETWRSHARPDGARPRLYLRLVDQRKMTWENRAQFFGLAAQLRRRILVDHARARHAGKRGDPGAPVSLDVGVEEADNRDAPEDVLAINLALERLATLDAEQARIVELPFFAGLTVGETAHVVNRSPRTIKREWRLARAWLFRELRA
jgi:RNA polymerase sigma factor (TIGR02999 family)